MKPYSIGGGYLNRHQSEEEGEIQSAYGKAKYKRLVTLKNKYDPTNFFRFNDHIRPTAI